jgi:hypothetical protein
MIRKKYYITVSPITYFRYITVFKIFGAFFFRIQILNLHKTHNVRYRLVIRMLAHEVNFSSQTAHHGDGTDRSLKSHGLTKKDSNKKESESIPQLLDMGSFSGVLSR